ncbi:hypothetical protein GQR58_015676 [Nymphon striatum]|nr:hypothetical protein GQR58_015676 [Nymphon striatum]
MIGFRRLFGQVKCAVIGMIHVDALPGTPNSSSSIINIVDKACEEAELYKSAGVNGIMLENMHDIPYVTSVNIGPEIVSCMTKVAVEVKKVVPPTIPMGIQILAGANEHALAVALAAGLDFVRVECFVFSHVADEGIMNGCAGPLLRYRRQIGAQNILIFADIKKKHSSHSLTEDVSISEMAKAAQFFNADGIIVTGSSTGQPADLKHLYGIKNVKRCRDDYAKKHSNKMRKRLYTSYGNGDVKASTEIPLLIGSGVTIQNWSKYCSTADAVIIGSHFKVKGEWKNSLDVNAIKKFMHNANI